MMLMKYALLWLVFLMPQVQRADESLKSAAKANFEELNAVRQNPKLYAQKYKLPALAKISPRAPFTWDDALAKLAQQKAEDMARHNYFGHIDKKGKGLNYYLWQVNYPLPSYYSKEARANNVESIAANTESPLVFVQQLIEDQGVPSLGHRKHLLSLNEESTPATHIGIGIAYNPNSKYKYYCSILIAPKVEVP
ncbi:CAP domain-containing protein [Pontibacter pamirensis]|uniref:CAP domain-containing protein n=1 Tax=Pontibacter pamirensis TaxID=2562824 RepID=UPI00138A43C6|nr:CAP domain-containing protein [Pontibacter pamirensis]